MPGGTAHRYTEERPQVGDFGVIVTCPKNNRAFLDAKVENVNYAFWNFQRKPTKFNPGDLFYVVYDGAIRYAFISNSVEHGPKPPVDNAGGHNPQLYARK